MTLEQALNNIWQALGQLNMNRETHIILEKSFLMVKEECLKQAEQKN